MRLRQRAAVRMESKKTLHKATPAFRGQRGNEEVKDADEAANQLRARKAIHLPREAKF